MLNLTDTNFLIDKNFIRQGLGINEERFYKLTKKNIVPLWHTPMYAFNDTIIKYSRERGKNNSIQGIFADEDAKYKKSVTIDVDNLEPLIACPPSPSNVKPVREVAGKRVHSVFIGSCTNGRYEDIKIVADMFKGKKIASNVVCKIVPATREIWSG